MGERTLDRSDRRWLLGRAFGALVITILAILAAPSSAPAPAAAQTVRSTVTGACAGRINHVPGGADGTGTCWPGPHNTGVPAATTLTAYAGPCTIQTPNTVIDGKSVSCGLSIQAANVTIRNSRVNGIVALDTDRPASGAWSLTIADSEVDGGPKQLAAVSSGNLTVLRSNIHGGQTAVQCEENSRGVSYRTPTCTGSTYLPTNPGTSAASSATAAAT